MNFPGTGGSSAAGMTGFGGLGGGNTAGMNEQEQAMVKMVCPSSAQSLGSFVSSC